VSSGPVVALELRTRRRVNRARFREIATTPLTAFYGFCAARLRGEGWPAALFQAAIVALTGGFLT
jgi:hypothetical protein